jgi:hypothetical protein
VGWLADHAQAALRYALGIPGVASAVIGCCHESQVLSLIEYASDFQPLTRVERDVILAEGKVLSNKLGRRWGVA